MENAILYNGRRYHKHPKQKYFYVSRKLKNYSRCLHRQKWFDAFGEIPKGYEIHHKDGNPFNNEISNFELKTKSAHMSEHQKERFKSNPGYAKKFQQAGILKAVEWHKSKAGIDWHRQNAINTNFGNLIYGHRACDFCKVVYAIKNINTKFCSGNCKTKSRKKSGVDNIIGTCLNCENHYSKDKYSKTKFCSRKCSATFQHVNKCF